MPEESHLEEMQAAIRAQRQRRAVPRSMLSSDPAPAPRSEQHRQPERAPSPPEKRSLLARLRGR